MEKKEENIVLVIFGATQIIRLFAEHLKWLADQMERYAYWLENEGKKAFREVSEDGQALRKR